VVFRLETSQLMIVNVPVATVWTSHDSARDIDYKAISYPPQIEEWLNELKFETRLELCDRNLVQTQCLLGQEVLVLEKKGEWSHVIVLDQPSSKDKRGYPGWIPSVQLIESSTTKENARKVVVKMKKAPLYSEQLKKVCDLSYQTELPYLEEESEYIKVQTPSGVGLLKVEDVLIINCTPSGSGKDIVKAGEKFLGLPYLWGGMSSFGYDCSGFSYSMCKANGYVIPRDAHDQACYGVEIKLDQIQPGDLLFFAYEEGKGTIHHVGIYYGNGNLLHSPKTGKSVEIISLANTVYEKELCVARRYWKNAEA